MKFQYIFSIIFWSIYTIVPSGIMWYVNHNPHVLDDIALMGWEVHYFLFVFALCTGLGIYKTIERTKDFKKYLTYIKQ